MHLSFVAIEVIAALAVEKVDKPPIIVKCALLHDIIEDTEVTYSDVMTNYGKDIADGVLALSQDKLIAPTKISSSASCYSLKTACSLSNSSQERSGW